MLHRFVNRGPSVACFIRTDQLDGETDWKLRHAVPSAQLLPTQPSGTIHSGGGVGVGHIMVPPGTPWAFITLPTPGFGGGGCSTATSCNPAASISDPDPDLDLTEGQSGGGATTEGWVGVNKPFF